MAFKIPAAGEPVPRGYAELLDQLDRTVHQLDARFRIPLLGVRFGWDPIIGMIPIAGDIAALILALRIVERARELGADKALVHRMLVNVAVDAAIGLIPIAGTLLDIALRANLRNLQLLTDEIRRQRSPSAH